MRKLVIVIFFIIPVALFAQNSIQGNVAETNGNPIQFASAILLNSDSTLAHYCITNENGEFNIDNIPSGEFLMQISSMGYQTFYKDLMIPLSDNNIGDVVMKAKNYDLDEVVVSAERIPLLIKKDTIEYNAAAYKTKPDAVAEDLLRKLPGVEVDRAGNIRAMGENVSKVLVDGKEFFSTDPKVATKNLPAESLDKVQVYNKKTDESEFSGIDDSEYDKTINLILKDDMKQAIFGNIKLGGGYKDYYIGNTKIYRFNDKHQFALLGMTNNVNRPGFSFKDYSDFNGGIRNMIGSDGNISSSIPVNFGQAVNGEITSGAGGINYSYEFKKNNRFNISYMGNQTNTASEQTSYTINFTDENSFEQNSNQDGNQINYSHVLNLGWRNKSNTKQYFMLNGIITLSDNKSKSNRESQIYNNGDYVNSVSSNSVGASNMLKAITEGSLMRKGKNNWKMFKINGNIHYNQSIDESDWLSLTRLINNPIAIQEDQGLNKQKNLIKYDLKIIGLLKLTKGLYLEPSVKTGVTSEITEREQGPNQGPFVTIDSLDMRLGREYQWIYPELKLKYISKMKKHNINFILAYELGNQVNWLNDTSDVNKSISYLLPSVGWSFDYKSNRRLSINYRTSTNLPASSQLMPVIDNSNPMIMYFGNRELEPEYMHYTYMSWYIFDSYSFTSFFANANASYTKNKINQSILVDDDLRQTISLVNVPEDYKASLGFNFSTPIKPLGIKIKLGLNESWNKGLSYVNNIQNINTNLSHSIKLSFDNRKKDKWDVEVGGRLGYTDASYSIQKELNREYFNYSYFGEIRYNPNDRWHFSFTGDVVNYDALGFKEDISVPLLSAEISFYFMKNKRAMLTLDGKDLLNKNTGINRISEINYMRETNSNVIGRYVLISFTYKLNKFGSNNSNINITTN